MEMVKEVVNHPTEQLRTPNFAFELTQEAAQKNNLLLSKQNFILDEALNSQQGTPLECQTSVSSVFLAHELCAHDGPTAAIAPRWNASQAVTFRPSLPHQWPALTRAGQESGLVTYMEPKEMSGMEGRHICTIRPLWTRAARVL
mmetsp:Transcript_30548/g.64918  ORF Transcript_30548/g.64918 Transcript_30548/m.64918 type:complete len:144 (-) Transcript_30548:15-446(-)